MNTMKAVFIEEPGRIAVKRTKVPDIGPEDVLVETAYCGLCATDVAIFRGDFSKEFLPLIPGHEFSGRVAALGKNVSCIEIGDRVAGFL